MTVQIFQSWQFGVEWLPPSETFIRDQMNSMTRWSPLGVGLYPARHAEVAGWTATTSPRIARGLVRIGAGKVLIRRLRRHIGAHQVRAIHAHFGTSAINALEVADFPASAAVRDLPRIRRDSDAPRKAWKAIRSTTSKRIRVCLCVDRRVRLHQGPANSAGSAPAKIRVLHVADSGSSRTHIHGIAARTGAAADRVRRATRREEGRPRPA